ncbi:hypothetical protein FNF27_07703 [Cafeteria roenbergensis]|uniref:GPI mannosyltransferase 1 n=1 Tax=Cafeteria roenbergensis TaxID=33653 RepID=A0A5A8DMA1_CAFRO|nr:hypothetical protein FNF27_07703 [Cafeteria roenbergensis]
MVDRPVAVVLALGFVLRAGLVVFSEVWDEANPARKYTDVDYVVFTDAAREVVASRPSVTPEAASEAGDGMAAWMFGLGSPYDRATYRYTPGIIRGHEVAAALWLGAAVHFKIFPALFAIPMALAIDQHSDPASRPAEPLALLAPAAAEADAAAAAGRAMASWPAGDSLLTRATDCGRPGSSAEACLRWVRGFVSYRRVRFGVVSLAACGALTGAAVALYGHRCLHDAYIYHLGRTDPRHNFSPYFYSLYLADGTAGAASLGLAAFLPQLAVVLAAGFGLYRDLPLAMLVQAVAFVALNKVCTAQYFLWWQGLLPVAAAAARLGAPRSRDWFSASAGWALVAALFLAGQAGWLLQASDLEEGGRQTFLGVWGAGLVFLAVNTVVMVGLVLAGRGAPPVFHRGGLVKLGAAAGGGAIAPVEWALQAAGL